MYLHGLKLLQHNICHRDLKLENILLDEIGNAKVTYLGFGLLRIFFREFSINCVLVDCRFWVIECVLVFVVVIDVLR